MLRKCGFFLLSGVSASRLQAKYLPTPVGNHASHPSRVGKPTPKIKREVLPNLSRKRPITSHSVPSKVGLSQSRRYATENRENPLVAASNAVKKALEEERARLDAEKVKKIKETADGILKKAQDEAQRKQREQFEKDFSNGLPAVEKGPHPANATLALMNLSEFSEGTEGSENPGDSSALQAGKGVIAEKSDLDSLRAEFKAELEAERKRHLLEEQTMKQALVGQKRDSLGTSIENDLSSAQTSLDAAEVSSSVGGGMLGSVASQRERWVQADDEKTASAETEASLAAVAEREAKVSASLRELEQTKSVHLAQKKKTDIITSREDSFISTENIGDKAVADSGVSSKNLVEKLVDPKEVKLSALAQRARDQVAAAREENRRLRAQIAAIRTKASKEAVEKARKLLQTAEKTGSAESSVSSLKDDGSENSSLRKAVADKLAAAATFFGPSSLAEKSKVEDLGERRLREMGRAERRAMERQDIWSAQEMTDHMHTQLTTPTVINNPPSSNRKSSNSKVLPESEMEPTMHKGSLVADIVEAGHRPAAAPRNPKHKLDYEDDWSLPEDERLRTL